MLFLYDLCVPFLCVLLLTCSLLIHPRSSTISSRWNTRSHLLPHPSYLQGFPLNCLDGLLDSSIPSSFQFESSSISLLNFIFKSWVVFIIYISLMFLHYWASLGYLLSLNSFSLFSLSSFFVLL